MPFTKRPQRWALVAVWTGALCLAPGRRLFAEIPVGLAARGVSAQAALDNPLGLDVRDENGRPVSAALIRSELKQAAAKAAAATAGAFSRLPSAPQIVWLLEMAAGAAFSISEAGRAPAAEQILALAPGSRGQSKMPWTLLALAPISAFLWRASRRQRFCREDLRPCRAILRC